MVECHLMQGGQWCKRDRQTRSSSALSVGVIRKSVQIVWVTGMTTHNVLANGELRRNYDYMDRYKCSTEGYKILLFL